MSFEELKQTRWKLDFSPQRERARTEIKWCERNAARNEGASLL